MQYMCNLVVVSVKCFMLIAVMICVVFAYTYFSIQPLEYSAAAELNKSSLFCTF